MEQKLLLLYKSFLMTESQTDEESLNEKYTYKNVSCIKKNYSA